MILNVLAILLARVNGAVKIIVTYEDDWFIFKAISIFDTFIRGENDES